MYQRKMNFINSFFFKTIMCLVIGLFEITAYESHHREKRVIPLVFTPNTIMQFTIGPSFPVKLPTRTVSLDLALQQNIILPSNLSLGTYPPIITGKREAPDPEFEDIDRITLYKYFIEIIDNVGLNGRICLLRSVCEIGEFPMHTDRSESLLEEIVHYIFSPTEDLDDDRYDRSHENDEFYENIFKAELIGKSKGKCSREYSECGVSIVSYFTKLFVIN